METKDFDSVIANLKKINAVMWLYDCSYEEAKDRMHVLPYSDYEYMIIYHVKEFLKQWKPDEEEISEAISWYLVPYLEVEEIKGISMLIPEDRVQLICEKYRKHCLLNILEGR